jgi:hypothetical protein
MELFYIHHGDEATVLPGFSSFGIKIPDKRRIKKRTAKIETIIISHNLHEF